MTNDHHCHGFVSCVHGRRAPRRFIALVSCPHQACAALARRLHAEVELQEGLKEPVVRDIPPEDLPPPPPPEPKKKKKKKEPEEPEEPPPPPVTWTLADGNRYSSIEPGDKLKCLVSRRDRLETGVEEARGAEAHAELIKQGEDLLKVLQVDCADEQVKEDERLRLEEEARSKAEKKAKKKAKKKKD